jgi:hypothetical protein
MLRQVDLAGNNLIRLNDEVLKLEEQRFANLEWDHMPPVSVIGGTPPAYEA